MGTDVTHRDRQMVAWVKDIASVPGVTQGCLSRRPGKNQLRIDQTSMRDQKFYNYERKKVGTRFRPKHSKALCRGDLVTSNKDNDLQMEPGET